MCPRTRTAQTTWNSGVQTRRPACRTAPLQTTSVAGGKNVHAPVGRCAILSGYGRGSLSGWQRETLLNTGPGSGGRAEFSVRAGGSYAIMANILVRQIPGTVSKCDMVRVGAGCTRTSFPLAGIPKSIYKRIPAPECALNGVERRWWGRDMGLESKDGAYSLTPFMLVAVGFVR